MGIAPIDAKFLKSYPLRTYKKGEVIVFQAEAPRYAYVIAQGLIKAYNLTLDGDEKPVAFYKENDFFPSAWIFSQMAYSTYFYEIFSKEASLYCVDRQSFVDFLKNNPDYLYQSLVQQVAGDLSRSMHINALQQSRASDKIIYTLHFLAIGTGAIPEDQTLKLNVHLTHQDLANLTGLTRETTAVELNKLKRDGLVSYGPGKPYVIYLNKLTSLVNDRYLQELTLPTKTAELH